MRWLHSIADSMDMNLSKLQEILEYRGDLSGAIYEVYELTKSKTRLSD